MSDTTRLGPVADLHPPCRMTPERARRGYRLTTFLTSLRSPSCRDRFRQDPEALMRSSGLTDFEADLVRRRDCDGMLDHGASNVAIGKASPALGLTLVGRGAAGRGQTEAEFLAARRAANEGQPWHF